MPQKHLFRIKPTDFRDTEFLIALDRLDGEISKHFPIHLLEIPCSDYIGQNKGLGLYGRDVIVHHGNALFAQPPLSEFPEFEGLIRQTGYDGKISYFPVFSEGGLWVSGENFVLVSTSQKRYLKTDGTSGYFVPHLSNGEGNHHIDTDYNIFDTFRILYVSSAVFTREHLMRKLTQIAHRHSYELRHYPQLYNVPHPGINFISEGKKLVTSYIDSGERVYLEQRGAEVIEIPTDNIDPSAGVRCVYGEFYILNGVAGI